MAFKLHYLGCDDRSNNRKQNHSDFVAKESLFVLASYDGGYNWIDHKLAQDNQGLSSYAGVQDDSWTHWRDFQCDIQQNDHRDCTY